MFRPTLHLPIRAEAYRKGTYFAYVLDAVTRAKLLTSIPPAFEKTVCHHVTFCHGFSELHYERMISALKLEKSLDVRAVGYSVFDDLEVVSVTVNGQSTRHFTDSYYHITLSHGETRKAYHSNLELIKLEGVPQMMFEKPIILAGELQLVNM